MAALLAQQDFVATREFLTAKDGGLYNAYVDGGKPDAATADLGTRWELEQIALRLWPSATLIQGMNTALFDLVQKHQDRCRRGCARSASRSARRRSTCMAAFRPTRRNSKRSCRRITPRR